MHFNNFQLFLAYVCAFCRIVAKFSHFANIDTSLHNLLDHLATCHTYLNQKLPEVELKEWEEDLWFLPKKWKSTAEIPPPHYTCWHLPSHDETVSASLCGMVPPKTGFQRDCRSFPPSDVCPACLACDPTRWSRTDTD